MHMDALREHDLAVARETPPGEKLRQALDAMAVGIRLKRESLRRAHPDASDEELDRLMLEWLLDSD